MSARRTDRHYRDIPLYRKLLYSIILTVAALGLVEIALRVVYFQSGGDFPLACVEFYDMRARSLAERRADAIAEKLRSDLNLPDNVDLYDAPYLPEGEDLLVELKVRYDGAFKELVAETEKTGSPLVALFVPYEDYDSPSPKETMDMCRQFYRELCGKLHVDFLDLTDVFLRFPSHVTTLLPDDPHLSRFGHGVVARELGAHVQARYKDARTAFSSRRKPRHFGDFKPNENTIDDEVLPFSFRTNRQGLRMDYDVSFPKTRQRILVLGDSVTFGPFVENQETYVAVLNRLYPGSEYINAAVSGYTISDELSLFTERARHMEPDLVILQVSVNDIAGMFYALNTLSNRKGEVFEPTDVEMEFVERLRSR